MRLIRYVLTVTLLICCWSSRVLAWQTVPGDPKTLARQLSALIKDSTLTDSVRNTRIRTLVTAYTAIIEKSRPLPPTLKDSARRKIDTVYLTRSTDKVVIYTDSAQVALLKKDIEAHAMKGTNTFLYVLLFFLLATGAAACWFLVRALEKIDTVRSFLSGNGIVQPAFQPMPHPATEPSIELSTSPAIEPSTSPATSPVIEPSTQSATSPVIEPSTQSATSPVIEPSTQSATSRTFQLATSSPIGSTIQPLAQSPFQAAIHPCGPPAETPHSFIGEIMMTAGPRKKFMSAPDADKDLGEDVCGFVMKAGMVGMWLLDGTSDLHCLRDPESRTEYFSSRLLAQHIGNALRKSFAAEGDDRESLSVTMDKAIAAVKQDWLRTIAALPESEKIVLKKNIQSKNFPQCASTLLSARLSLDGRLEAYRSGDSKMLLFRQGPDRLMPDEPSFTTKNKRPNDRIFFTLDLDGNNDLDITYREPRFELLHKDGIRDLIAFSDGIGALTEQTLREEFDQDREAVRRRIITETQATADDKCICFIQIRDNR